jgi:hypothetical protein
MGPMLTTKCLPCVPLSGCEGGLSATCRAVRDEFYRRVNRVVGDDLGAIVDSADMESSDCPPEIFRLVKAKEIGQLLECQAFRPLYND